MVVTVAAGWPSAYYNKHERLLLPGDDGDCLRSAETNERLAGKDKIYL
jgi:hypothetical protein